MSFYDDASLVVIPSAQKTSKLYAVKPTDGSGDLAFTRTGDTATRVNSAGLIERVRTNLVLQSNTFSTTWTTTTATVASGQAGYDGTTNAWLLTKSGASGRINQSFSAPAALTTFSVYAKANASSYIAIEFSTSYVYVNLTNGAQGSFGTGTYKIDSVGNGWYRISMTTGIVSSIFRIYPAENNDLSATTGSIFIQNAQVERGDIATAYIPTTTAAVSTGPTANIARLDYLGSTCPRLLLEPQRTNLVTYSEQFNNAAWVKSGNGVGVTPVVTANNGISPDGYQNADKIDLSLGGGTTSSDWSWVYQTFTVTANQPQAISIYLRAATAGDVGKVITLGLISYVEHTLTADWTRVKINQTIGSTASYSIGFRLRGTEGTASTASLYAWGAQLEQNAAYSSSYIPTLAASATRGADACSKTGISSLIGQTEGTLFYEFSVPANENLTRSIGVTDGTVANRINISVFATSLFARVDVGGVNQVNSSATIVPTAMNKVAFRYKANDFAAYVNGVKVITDTSGSTFSGTTLSSFSFIQPDGTSAFSGAVKQVLFFKTALIDAELATLTAL